MNKVEIGLGRKNGKFENVFYATSNLNFIPGLFNLNLSYNLNNYLKGNKSYIPLWIRARNTRRIVGYEEGYHPHTLRFSIGSGYGRVFKLAYKLSFRAEFGAGISLNLTNSSGNVFPFKTNFLEYQIDQQYPKYNPPIVPALRLKLNFIYK